MISVHAITVGPAIQQLLKASFGAPEASGCYNGHMSAAPCCWRSRRRQHLVVRRQVFLTRLRAQRVVRPGTAEERNLILD